MSQWVRNAVMLVVLGVWAVVVLYALFILRELPNTFTWGVPGMIWLALSPTKKRATTPPVTGETPT